MARNNCSKIERTNVRMDRYNKGRVTKNNTTSIEEHQLCLIYLCKCDRMNIFKMQSQKTKRKNSR